MWLDNIDSVYFLIYTLEDRQIIKIYNNKDRSLSSFDQEEKDYYALIMSPYRFKVFNLTDNDLEILKLRSLIKANEVGWDIKKINV